MAFTLRRTLTAPATAGTVGCRTCSTTEAVPTEGSGQMLWDFFTAHPAPCATWVDVTGVQKS